MTRIDSPLSGRELTTEETLLDQVRSFAKKCFNGARGSHDWDHTLRVEILCRRIGLAEGADGLVLRTAAYLHDIGRSRQDESQGALCHAREGARLAEPLVRTLDLTEDRKRNVIHCIEAHRFRGNRAPDTLEARVLFDADKLDAIGAVGVARAFLFAGEVGARLHNPEMNLAQTRPYSENDTGFREYKLKLSKIKQRILTAEGRRLAARRHDFMAQFFGRFLEEYQGKE